MDTSQGSMFPLAQRLNATRTISKCPLSTLEAKTYKLYSHTHVNYEFLMILSGDIQVNIADKVFTACANDVFLIPPKTPHHIICLSDHTYDRLVIEVPPPTQDLLSVMNFVFNGNYKIHLTQHFEVLELFARYRSYYEKLPYILFARMQTNFLIELFCTCQLNLAQKEDATQGKKILSDTLLYIDEHIASLADVEEVADNLYVSKSYLYKLFQKNLSISPKQYIEQRRLRLAYSYISTGTAPTLVAPLVGYMEYSTFYRAYKRYFHVAPSIPPEDLD